MNAVKCLICCAISIFSMSFGCTSMMFWYHRQAIVAHNFDWFANNTDVVINPIGEKYSANNIPSHTKPLTWHARYGSVTFDYLANPAKFQNPAVTSGMNQKGLVVSLLVLEPTQYPKPKAAYPTINNVEIVGYLLDQFATVSQAIAGLKHINVVSMSWKGHETRLHFALHDASGHNAVVEYLDGKLRVFSGKDRLHRAIANTAYPAAMALLKAYKAFGGSKDLPGGYHSKARFVRAAAFLKRLPKAKSGKQAIGYAFAGLQDVAEAPGTGYPTVWSAVYNTHTLKLYYRTLSNPVIRQLNLASMTFRRQIVIPINGYDDSNSHGG